jgi:hypothetical protein
MQRSRRLARLARQITRRPLGRASLRPRTTYGKAKVATEQAADLFKATYATVAKSTSDYNVRIVEIARANTNAAFEFIQKN